MSQFNFGELIELLRIVTDDPKDRSYKIEYKMLVLNASLRHFARKVSQIFPKFYFSIKPLQAEANNPEIALPDDCRSTIAVLKNQENQIMIPGKCEEFNTATIGFSTEFDLTGRSIYLFPTPDQNYNYTLQYYKIPKKMLEMTDIPEFPDGEDILPYYAAFHYKLSRSDSVEEIRTKYLEMWREIEKTLKEQQTYFLRRPEHYVTGPNGLLVPLDDSSLDSLD